jgi:hypothetical protein
MQPLEFVRQEKDRFGDVFDLPTVCMTQKKVMMKVT